MDSSGQNSCPHCGVIIYSFLTIQGNSPRFPPRVLFFHLRKLCTKPADHRRGNVVTTFSPALSLLDKAYALIRYNHGLLKPETQSNFITAATRYVIKIRLHLWQAVDVYYNQF